MGTLFSESSLQSDCISKEMNPKQVHFFSNMFYGSNIYDSFANAQKIMEHIQYQTPQLNADNDANTNERNDYEEVNADFIRTGEPNKGDDPIIQNVNDPLILHDTTAGTIQARGISDQDGISRVYAMILSFFLSYQSLRFGPPK
ncbi:MAG: hypothetical protein OMM_09396 [Candidatus Magnetoglobus multicellularis str. Araruama]|uniref:Uncharacterized protein n=1 Tax=Candidatus Magnetoglobus multicellularis str. Araruama TaxID=890399 RepID=A0A1V1P499_9BACT|nr:MAG: hypothetical protein OMM_09396 [Candidatus Magnetoglobus multicellularis str. Araruama]